VRSNLAIALVFGAACGGNPNGVDGSYHGQAMDISDGVLLPPQRTTDGSEFTVVALESESEACILLQTRAVNNSRVMTVALGIAAPSGLVGAATESGSYQIGAPGFVTAGTKLAAIRFGVIGPCGAGTLADATSGTVQLAHVQTAADGSIAHVDGTFEAVFDSGEKATGHFGVSACAGARIIFGVCP